MPRLEQTNLPRTFEGKILIAGPCSAESEEQVLQTARELSSMGIKIFRAGIWKPRTKPGTFEGVGQIGLGWMKKAKEETGMLTATEVATKQHAKLASEAGIDIVWIGARTVTNPFAVQEIADELAAKEIAVLVKNPITPDTESWIGAIERLSNAGIKNIIAVHRGFSAYGKMTYRNRQQWDIPLELRSKMPNITIICDPSHIAGDKRFIKEICQQAMDLGMDGLIVETHINPPTAKSDAKQQVTPGELKDILGALEVGLSSTKGADEQLNALRARIDEIDANLIDALAQRMEMVCKIGEYKKERKQDAFQPQRYNEVLQKWTEAGKRSGLDPSFVARLYEIIHSEAVARQL